MKLASFLPSSSLLTIYRSLFESRLRYCDVVWGSCNNNLKEKLQRQQDRAIHIVTKQRFKNNTEQAYNELEVLNVQQLIDFDTSTMMFKLISGTTPDYLNDLFVPASQIHDHYTRHAMSGFYPYQYNQNYGLRSFAHTGCRLWNSLSEDVHTSDSLKSFKQRLHKVYFPTNGGE